MRSTVTALAQLYLVALPWMAIGKLALFDQIVIFADLVFVPLALAVVIERFATRTMPARATLVFSAACTGYALAFVISALASFDPHRALAKSSSALYVAAIGVVFALFAEDHQRRQSLLRAWRVAAALVVAYAALALVAVLADGPEIFARGLSPYAGSLPTGTFRRPTASFLNFNMLCAYLTASTCVLVWLRDDARGESALARRATDALLVVVIVLALTTLSPTVGGLVLALALLAAHRVAHVWRRRAFVVVGVSIALAIFVSTWISPRALTHEGELALGPRPLCWQAAIDAWLASFRTFLVGNGPGIPVFEVHALAGAGFTARLTDAHHVFLSVGVQAGLLGVIALVVVLAVVARGAWRARVWERDGAANERFTFVVAAFVLWGYDGLTGSFEDTRHFWVVLGLASGALASSINGARPRG